MQSCSVLAIFHRQIEGDDALLRLMGRRFQEARLGAEIYPGHADEAHATLEFVPPTRDRHVLHAPRHLDLLQPRWRDEIAHLGERMGQRVLGLVVHDRLSWEGRFDELLAGLAPIGERLAARGGPRILLEYAAGLPHERFIELAERLAPLAGIGICIDTGHIGTAATRRHFAERCPDVEMLSLADRPDVAARTYPQLQEAAELGIADLAETVRRIAALGEPLHFHLHDMHPLSTLSRYGVRDHLSFEERVPVSHEISEEGTVGTLLGAPGLRRVLTAAQGAGDVTITVEVHPTLQQSREPLGPHEELFHHWGDRTHAELTNSWMSVLTRNAAMVREAVATGGLTG